MKPLLAALLFLLVSSPLMAQNPAPECATSPSGRGPWHSDTVAPTDPIKSGRFYIRYILNRNVRVATARCRPSCHADRRGQPADHLQHHVGGRAGHRPSSTPVTFDPNTAITFQLVSSNDFYINLGGRVAPAAAQATGNYTGTVTLTCTFF